LNSGLGSGLMSVFLPHEFVSQFSQNWYQIFINGLLYRALPEFEYLGKLLTYCNDDVIKFSHVPYTLENYMDRIWQRRHIIFRDMRTQGEHDTKVRF